LSWQDAAAAALAFLRAHEVIKGRLSPEDLAKRAVPGRKALRPADLARLGVFGIEGACPSKKLKTGLKDSDVLFNIVQGFR
jgi:hypothetical protein